MKNVFLMVMLGLSILAIGAVAVTMAATEPVAAECTPSSCPQYCDYYPTDPQCRLGE